MIGIINEPVFGAVLEAEVVVEEDIQPLLLHQLPWLGLTSN